MLNTLWVLIILCSCTYAVLCGRCHLLTDAFFNGAQNCVSFMLKTGAIMLLWQGILSVAEKSKLTNKISCLMSPLVSRLFTNVKKGSNEARLICANISANMLGLSNAATPLGIEAMKGLSGKMTKNTATNDMCLLAIINCASVQLIPSTLIALRSTYNSTSPGEIIPLVWVSSFFTLIFSLILAKLFEKHKGGI